MSKIAKYLKQHTAYEKGFRGPMQKQFDHIECVDGFTMSVQASRTHYCRPREDGAWWDQVEVGYPSAEEPLLMPYAESPETPTMTVYGYVPVEVIDAVIEKHGGMKEQA